MSNLRTDSDEDVIASKIASAFKRHSIDGKVEDVKRLVAGESSQSWAFNLIRGSESAPYIVQRSLGEEVFDLAITRSQQAQIQTLAHENGIPVPEILFVFTSKDGLGDGYVSGYLAGETQPKKIQANPKFEAFRAGFIDETAMVLSDIHNVNIDSLDDVLVRDIEYYLEIYQKIYERYNTPIAMFDYALAWLKANKPDEIPPCLVHGDFRLGNLMADEEKYVAILDWELAHVGDLYEDLAWIALPPWRYKNRKKPIAGLGDYQEFFAAYEKYSGHTVDPVRAHYWRVLGQLKWGIMCMFMTFQHISGDVSSIERAAIGRRISECEVDLITMIGDV